MDKTKAKAKAKAKVTTACDKFCARVFLPAKEAADRKASREQGVPPPRPLRTNPVVRAAVMDTCRAIYCNPGCGCTPVAMGKKDVAALDRVLHLKAQPSQRTTCKKAVKCPGGELKVVSCREASPKPKVVATAADFVPTVTARRKRTLQAKGALSVCRDLRQEFPRHYQKHV